MRRVRAFLPGGAVLVLASAFHLTGADALVQQVTDRYSLVLCAVGIALASAFHRSRVVAALLALGLVHYRVSTRPDGAVFFAYGCTLVGLFGLLAATRDRGIFSKGGGVQLGVTAALASVPAVALSDPERADAFRGVGLLPDALTAWSGAPSVMTVVGAGSLALAFWGLCRWGGPVERALVWSQVLLLVAIHPGVEPPGSALFVMGAGLTLTLSVLETSYAMAYLDELTGLPARRALMNDLAGLGGTYALAMVDVDHFKKFNDKHGHDVGDQVLKLVATRLAKAPGGGKAYRYGGEEFTLLYPGRTSDEATPHLDKVRKSIAEARFTVRAWNRPRRKPQERRPKRRKGSQKLSVTVSVGVAHASGKSGAPKDILKQADEALYRAKETGRNRICG